MGKDALNSASSLNFNHQDGMVRTFCYNQIMKVVMSMAVSVNGIIADENGSEDFLSHENWIQFSKLANKIGNNVWGRKTYEAVTNWPREYLDDLRKVTKIVISQDKTLHLDPGFTRVDSPQDAVSYLSSQGFKEMLVTGGSSIYSAFLQVNLVDEIIFDLEPVIIGKGVPAFAFDSRIIKMQLLEVSELAGGLIEIHYRVIK